VKIVEILNTKIHLVWVNHDRFELTNFSAEGIEYVIQIEKKPLPFDELKNQKTAEISFFRTDDDSERAYLTSHLERHQFSVYGAVANALAEKFNDYDAFYFVANRRHSDDDEQFRIKKKIYRFAADRMAKKIGAFLYVNSGTDEDFLVTRVKIKKNGYIIEAEEAKKQLGPPTVLL